MVAAIVYDAGIGRVTGYSLGGRKDVMAAVRETLEPAKSLGANELTNDAGADTDNFDFLLEGVPTLLANQEPANYMTNYHAASDTFDKVDIAQLKRHVALAALTAFAIADRPERLGKRQSRAEIEALMKDTGLDIQMRTMGFMASWESGARGRER
jgi:carboxypeptidase Q